MKSQSITMFVRPIVFCVCAAIGSIAFADPETFTDSNKVEIQKFSVWTSGGCSRSLQQVESFQTAAAALSAAEKLRGKERPFVVVLSGDATRGDAVQALNFQRGVEPEKIAIQCSVYRQGCRLGWSQVGDGTKRDLKSAVALTAELKAANTTAAMVFHAEKR